jgi:hypothetical protein
MAVLVPKWHGKGDVSGTGELEITDGEPGNELKMELRFMEPWQMTSTNTFTFEETRRWY